MSGSDWLYRPFARVWGRSLGELTLEIRDPVGRGLLHAPRPALVRGSIDEGGAVRPSVADDRDGRSDERPAPPSRSRARSARHARRAAPASSAAEVEPGVVVLRPAWGRDHTAVDAVRRANADWLSPWEATLPPGTNEILPDLAEYTRKTDREQRAGRALVMIAEVDGEIAGQFSLSNVQRGAMSQGMLGYWLARSWSGRGLGVLGAALVIDLVIGELGLHRVEVDVRPENAPSLGLCRRLGLTEEGLRPRFMHINGAWADHLAFSIDAESLPPGGLVRARLEESAEE